MDLQGALRDSEYRYMIVLIFKWLLVKLHCSREFLLTIFRILPDKQKCEVIDFKFIDDIVSIFCNLRDRPQILLLILMDSKWIN